ncbi:MAG: glutamine synthetase III [Candidatus Treponema excrementipullorum]|uniref:Glutamine synthetase III n=1 Tax=Candidatus Treponema excrementipullorum TaxID=2838768 RepID=A0A9E2L140_9SPIR|nr:glutamine synthetase III [Candidatus Treponema excrementipullorum]
MEKLSELFGSMVFNETVMRERLPQETFNTLKKTMDQGIPLEEGVANIVANAMKDWAVEKGATHFTHWFQPMTGITAEKHDSFISPQKNGTVIMNFSGKELIKGEPDGSSFPSGGIRATCEARGYTAWDPTSPAFIKDGSLCIPTAFCSYGGEALDKKTPLLRSMDAIDRQSKRILALFGKTVKRVSTTVGPEQEYFLIDADLYRQREDLKLTGRTLFGAPASKGQELDDHYFGVIRTRVSEFMKDLDKALWELGIPAKTKHNEVAPAQHELAPIFSTTNIAADHNQLTMELMKKIAKKHNLVCLLHEKPFAGVNGSGKHNNWSLTTDTGENLLEPGKTPEANAQFLLILTAVIKGVDEYQDLLRASVATAGNDHRLGANEAPPAIISMFVGDELEALLESIQKGVPYDSKDKEVLRLGVDALPDLPKDNTDRNRTSPFAFTGNKFEFRSLGSSLSISCPNIMLNTIIAEEFRQFADILESSQDFNADLNKLIKTTLHQHSRIIFNGNGYSQEWVEEAKQRGLLNLKTTTDAMPTFLEKKNVQLFEQHGVYTEKEMKARYEIQMEEYTKTLLIEARTMITMVYRQIGPAVLSYIKSINETIEGIQKTSSMVSVISMKNLVQKLAENYDMLMDTTQVLGETIQKVGELSDVTEQAIFCTSNIIPTMEKLRTYADTLETITAKESWPFPVYSDLLFYE